MAHWPREDCNAGASEFTLTANGGPPPLNHRYAHQTGHYVERKFGWDTHGLPVEYEIDKTHNIKGPADVMAMGIPKYNKLCRDIVMRYSGEWRETVTRLGT